MNDEFYNKLMQAVELGNCEEILRLIMTKSHPIDKETLDAKLIFAILHQDVEQVRYLLDAGADPNAGNSDEGTSLMWAAVTGNLTIVNMVLEKGAKLNIKNDSDVNALLFTIVIKNHDVVKILINWNLLK